MPTERDRDLDQGFCALSPTGVLEIHEHGKQVASYTDGSLSQGEKEALMAPTSLSLSLGDGNLKVSPAPVPN